MKTTELKVIMELDQTELLTGEKVIAVSHDPIGGYFLKGDELEITQIVGSMIRVYNEKNKSNCLVNVNRLTLKNPIKLKTYCISCNSPHKNRHLTNCATFQIDEMIEDNKKLERGLA